MPGTIEDRDGKVVNTREQKLRAIDCVAACAGMADPAKDIQALRDKLDDKTVMHLPLLEKLAAAEKRIRDLHETIQGIESDARDLRKFKKFPESVESLACSILLKLKSTTP